MLALAFAFYHKFSFAFAFSQLQGGLNDSFISSFVISRLPLNGHLQEMDPKDTKEIIGFSL